MSAAKPGSHISLAAWRSRVKEWHEVTREPGLTALLIIEALLIFLVVPLTGMGVLPEFILPAMFILLVISILVVTWHSHIASIAVTTAVLLSPIGTFLWREDPSPLTEWLSAGGRLLAISAVSLTIARAVFASGRVTFHRVQGAIVLYLNFALLFFTIYRLIEVLLPNSFSDLPHAGRGIRLGRGAAIFQLLNADDTGLRRYRAGTSIGAQSRQSRRGDWTALSGDAVGAACQPGNRAPPTIQK